MNNISKEEKLRIKKKRKLLDGFYNGLTLGSSFVGVITLIAIFIYVFI